MAVNEEEGILERAKEFLLQSPKDRAYEDEGGDDRVPEDERTENPKADANRFAASQGEKAPYPESEDADAAVDSVSSLDGDEDDVEDREPNPHAEGVVVDDEGERI